MIQRTSFAPSRKAVTIPHRAKRAPPVFASRLAHVTQHLVRASRCTVPRLNREVGRSRASRRTRATLLAPDLHIGEGFDGRNASIPLFSRCPSLASTPCSTRANFIAFARQARGSHLLTTSIARYQGCPSSRTAARIPATAHARRAPSAYLTEALIVVYETIVPARWITNRQRSRTHSQKRAPQW